MGPKKKVSTFGTFLDNIQQSEEAPAPASQGEAAGPVDPARMLQSLHDAGPRPISQLVTECGGYKQFSPLLDSLLEARLVELARGETEELVAITPTGEKFLALQRAPA